MDVEAELRRNLILGLTSEFDCLEEVSLKGTDGKSLRADVLAVPKAYTYQRFVFAFEVKQASGRNFQKWTHVFRQAFDYVGANTANPNPLTVNSAFVFPAPPYDPYGSGIQESEFWRAEQSMQIAGVIHMAAMLNVGAACWVGKENNKVLSLNFGPNGIWQQGLGWLPKSKERLTTRRTGSRKTVIAQ
jgi:hypothetical protein